MHEDEVTQLAQSVFHLEITFHAQKLDFPEGDNSNPFVSEEAQVRSRNYLCFCSELVERDLPIF